MPKISILIFLLEVYTGFKYLNVNILGEFQYLNETLNMNSVIKNLLLLSSLLSLIIGSVVGLVQTKIKRLLAYSTISHIGFILLALAINSEQSIDSFLFYIIQYTITNLNIFLIIIGLGYIRKEGIFSKSIDINEINEFKGLFFSFPLICICFSICLFSMAGIPPLMGFFSKQFVLYSALQNGYNFMSIVCILVSVISASYYLKIIKVLMHEEAPNEKNHIKYSLNQTNTNALDLEYKNSH